MKHKLTPITQAGAPRSIGFAEKILERQQAFCQRFSIQIVPLRLKLLEFVPLKPGPYSYESPLFQVSPRISLSITPLIKTDGITVNMSQHHKRNHPAIIYRQRENRGGDRSMQPAIRRITAMEHKISQVMTLKTVSGPAPVEIPRLLLDGQPMIQKIYRQNPLTGTAEKASTERRSSFRPAVTVRQPATALSTVFLKRLQAVRELEDALNPAESGLINYTSLMIHSGSHINNIHRAINRVFSLGGSKTLPRLAPPKANEVPARPFFSPLKRVFIQRVEQVSEKTALPLKKQPGPANDSTPKAGSMELAIKKVNRMENQLDTTKLERTVTQKVNRQVEETLKRQLNSNALINPRETRRLEENLYSRLVDRMALEKERMEY